MQICENGDIIQMRIKSSV